MILGKEVLKRKSIFFIFPAMFVWNISYSKKNWMYIDLYWKRLLFLSGFNKTWISLTEFKKNFEYKLSCKSLQWEPSCSLRTVGEKDGQTGMAKLTVVLPDITIAQKIVNLDSSC